MCTVWEVTIWESHGVRTLFERKHHIQQISFSPKSVMKTFFGLKSLFKESMWTILFNLCDTLQIAKGYGYPTVLSLCSGRGVGRGCSAVLWAIQKYSIWDALHLIRAKGVRSQPPPPFPRPLFLLRGKEHISLAASQQIVELSGSLSVDFG